MKRQSLAELADLCAVTSPDDAWDNILAHDSGVYHAVYEARIADGATERWAEKEASAAEDEEQDEQFRVYAAAVEAAAGYLLELHGIALDSDGAEYILYVEDEHATLSALVETINGVGYFYFASPAEFLASGPYTAEAAIESHLHWLRHRPEVYGMAESAKTVFDRHMR